MSTERKNILDINMSRRNFLKGAAFLVGDLGIVTFTAEYIHSAIAQRQALAAADKFIDIERSKEGDRRNIRSIRDQIALIGAQPKIASPLGIEMTPQQETLAQRVFRKDNETLRAFRNAGYGLIAAIPGIIVLLSEKVSKNSMPR